MGRLRPTGRVHINRKSTRVVPAAELNSHSVFAFVLNFRVDLSTEYSVSFAVFLLITLSPYRSIVLSSYRHFAPSPFRPFLSPLPRPRSRRLIRPSTICEADHLGPRVERQLVTCGCCCYTGCDNLSVPPTACHECNVTSSTKVYPHEKDAALHAPSVSRSPILPSHSDC